MHVFVRTKYIYWLESLSLLGAVSNGILAMEKLENIVQVTLILLPPCCSSLLDVRADLFPKGGPGMDRLALAVKRCT